MEFRQNFFLDFLVALVWILSQLLIIEIYFQFTNDIFGWKKTDVFVLVGMFRLAKSLFDLLPRRNLFGLSNAITKGDIDYVLTRPIDSQFFVTFRYINASEISGVILGAAILLYGISLHKILLTPGLILIIMLGAFFGFVAYYSLMLIVVTISFYATRLNALPEIHDFISQTIRYPSDIFSRGQLFLEILIFPIVIITTLPARIVLGKLPPVYILIEIILSTAIALGARWFWKISIRKYSSASS